MQAVFVLIRAFFELCRLRLRPQDLPASAELLIVAIAAYGLSSAGLTLISQSVPVSLMAGAVDSLMLLGLTYGVLLLRRVPGRWLQTSIAMAGTGALLTMLAMPLYAWLAHAGGAQGGGLSPAVSLLILVIIVWNVVVMGHILRHALSFPLPGGILVSMGYVWAINATMGALLPGQGVQ